MTPKIHTIDLHFKNKSQTIAAFLIETDGGLVLVESGPDSTYPQLQKGIEDLGFLPSQVRWVLLTHIHFDHAGAAWRLARLGAKIAVHPKGYKHLQDPEKLYKSAKRIYGDQMETLWGQMKPIDEKQLHETHHNEKIMVGNTTFTAHHTPGHASHHIAWQLNSQKTIFTGDVAGIKISRGIVVPPCPPPDLDIEQWLESIDLLLSLKPDVFYLTHYGKVTAIVEHCSQLKKMLIDRKNWIKPYVDANKTIEEITPLFIEYINNELKEHNVSLLNFKRYEAANPAFMSVEGLMRYWQTKQ